MAAAPRAYFIRACWRRVAFFLVARKEPARLFTPFQSLSGIKAMIFATSRSFWTEGDKLAPLTGNLAANPLTPAQSIMRMAHSSS